MTGLWFSELDNEERNCEPFVFRQERSRVQAVSPGEDCFLQQYLKMQQLAAAGSNWRQLAATGNKQLVIAVDAYLESPSKTSYTAGDSWQYLNDLLLAFSCDSHILT